MNFLDVSMLNFAIRGAAEPRVYWAYQDDRDHSGLRWCFLELGDGAILVSCMRGNPAGAEGIKVLEEFRWLNRDEMNWFYSMEAEDDFVGR